MNTALWVIQAILATVFVVSGLLKSTRSKQQLVSSGQTGVSRYPIGFIRFIAICELAGAVGLIVPWLTGIAAYLTPTAASGFAFIMIGAAASHATLASRDPREWRNVAANIAIFSASVAVAVGRS